MTLWITAFCAFLAASSAAMAVLGALAAHRHAAAARELALREATKPSAASLQERISELEALLARMDQRDKMRQIRLGARQTAAEAEPDPHTNPTGWKAAMRRRKALGEFNAS